MPEPSRIKKIPVSEFISKCERTVANLLNRSIEDTTQFSTKFVVQKIVATTEKQVKDLGKNKSVKPETVRLPKRWLDDQKFDEHLNELIKPFDLENLNFLEASRLGILLNEFLITCYRSVERRTSDKEVKKIIGEFIALKTTYLTKLKKEYVRLSRES